ncbi:MAG: ATP-binding cassette domain-containing protein [Clostridium sp.]
MKLVETKNLSMSIDKRRVLHNINLSFESYNIYGIIGDNFSGRIELLKVLSGLIREYEGEVIILGNLIRKEIGFLDRVGISIGIEGFVGNRTGYKNLISMASIRGIIGDEDVKDALYLTGLDYNLKDKVSEYDFPMRKKLSIAQAIMEKPKVIIIDEPFMHLNGDEIKAIQKVFKSICESRRATIILGSRRANYINEICNEVFNIEDGKI